MKTLYGQDFKMRIGLNSGQVVVASIGDDLRMDYTAIGDTTNLASRMESAARPVTILVSDHTHRLVRDFFDFELLGKITVKGKEEPQDTYELMKVGKVETRIEAAGAKGLTRFVARYNSIKALVNGSAYATVPLVALVPVERAGFVKIVLQTIGHSFITAPYWGFILPGIFFILLFLSRSLSRSKSKDKKGSSLVS